MGCEGAIIHRDLKNREGRTPKPLGFFAIFRFSQTSRQLRRTSEGAGVSAATFRWCGAAGGIYFTSIRLQRKQKRRILFTFGMSCPRDHRKRQSERSPARAASIALRDHRLPETANIEKVGRTRFFNLFRIVISFCRLVMAIVCKLCPREKLPPHL